MSEAGVWYSENRDNKFRLCSTEVNSNPRICMLDHFSRLLMIVNYRRLISALMVTSCTARALNPLASINQLQSCCYDWIVDFRYIFNSVIRALSHFRERRQNYSSCICICAPCVARHSSLSSFQIFSKQSYHFRFARSNKLPRWRYVFLIRRLESLTENIISTPRR